MIWQRWTAYRAGLIRRRKMFNDGDMDLVTPSLALCSFLVVATVCLDLHPDTSGWRYLHCFSAGLLAGWLGWQIGPLLRKHLLLSMAALLVSLVAAVFWFSPLP